MVIWLSICFSIQSSYPIVKPPLNCGLLSCLTNHTARAILSRSFGPYRLISTEEKEAPMYHRCQTDNHRRPYAPFPVAEQTPR
jgi:hypothetical protein